MFAQHQPKLDFFYFKVFQFIASAIKILLISINTLTSTGPIHRVIKVTIKCIYRSYKKNKYLFKYYNSISYVLFISKIIVCNSS